MREQRSGILCFTWRTDYLLTFLSFRRRTSPASLPVPYTTTDPFQLYFPWRSWDTARRFTRVKRSYSFWKLYYSFNNPFFFRPNMIRPEESGPYQASVRRIRMSRPKHRNSHQRVLDTLIKIWQGREDLNVSLFQRL